MQIPLWTTFLSPAAIIASIIVSTYFVLRNLELYRTSISTSAILQLENGFWEHHAGAYARVEKGELDNVDFSDITIEQLLMLDKYLNFFNTLGLMAEKGAVDFPLTMVIYPYRLQRVLSLKCVNELVDQTPFAWKGLIYLRQNLTKDVADYYQSAEELRNSIVRKS